MRIGMVLAVLLVSVWAWGTDVAKKMLPATPEAVMIRSTAMVPLLPMAELLGGTMTARGTSVEFTLEHAQLVFTMGSPQATVNGEAVSLPVPPFERAGVVYVPLRALITGVGGMLSMDKGPHRTLAQVPTHAGRVDLHFRESESYPTIAAYHEYDTELYVCNTDGSGLHRLTYNTQLNELAGVSPDGRYLAYDYDDQLCLRAFADPVERVLAPWYCGVFTNAPVFSPDGTTILFVRHFPHPHDRGEETLICTVKTDGTGCRQWYKGDYARYAPDGSMIAFLHTDNLSWKTILYCMDPDGSHRRAYGEACTMAFSGDGRYLQYTVPVAHGKYVRRVIPVHARETIPDSPPFSEAALGVDEATTPDLSTVVFSGRAWTEDGIHLADANRTHVMRLTSGPLDEAPLFTTDQSHILFLSNNGLYVMDRDGSHPRPLVTDMRVDSYTLTPDGTRIIFSAAPENPPIAY